MFGVAPIHPAKWDETVARATNRVTSPTLQVPKLFGRLCATASMQGDSGPRWRVRTIAAAICLGDDGGRPRAVHAGPIVRCTCRPSGRRYFARHTGRRRPSTRNTCPDTGRGCIRPSMLTAPWETVGTYLGHGRLAARCPVSTDNRVLLGLRGAPGRIRTCDLRIRSPLLYPAELRGPRGTRVGPARSGRPDSNRRPFGPKPNALPSCATPRLRGSMAGREDRRHRTSVGSGAAGLKSSGARDRGGPWGPCSLALATASLPCSRSLALAAPAAALRRRGPGARARAAGDRCATADAMPGQATGRRPARQATLCLMNAERTARGLGRLQAEPLLSRVAVDLRAPDGPRAASSTTPPPAGRRCSRASRRRPTCAT